ncbi:MAG: alpha-amylase family glycosyl hydrolase, partial [Bacillota bacterium]
VGEYWIKEFDIDGWRLDVSNEISHDFWRAFRKRVRATKKDVFILGENWDQSEPWLMGDQHDAVMNYEFLYPMWAFFGKNEPYPMDARAFANTVRDVMFTYPRPVIQNMFNIIDSHDTKRIARVLEEDEALLKLVYTVQYLLPGAPSVYYGGEVGLSGEHDPDNRRCMIWDEKRHSKILKPFIKKLNHLYHEEPSFRLPTLDILATENQAMILEKGELIALLNRGKTPVTFDVHSLSGTYHDLFDQSSYTLSETVTLKPYALHLLKRTR